MGTPVNRVLYLHSATESVPALTDSLAANPEFEVTAVASLSKAKAALDWRPLDCVLVPPAVDGTPTTDYIEHLRTIRSDVPVVLYLNTAGDPVESREVAADADEYLRYGADWDHPDLLETRLRSVIEQRRTRERLRRQQAFFQRTQDLADVGGWELDRDRGRLRWSQQVYDIHDLDHDFEPTVDDALEFYHPEDRDRIEARVAELIADAEAFDERARIVTAEEAVKWVRVRGSPDVIDGELRYIRGTMQDVTTYVERQTEVRKLCSELEDEQSRLEELARVIAHELRNPMNAATGQLTLHRERPDEDRLDVVERNLARLEVIVEDMLWLLNGDDALEALSMLDIATVATDAWRVVEADDIDLTIEPFEAIPGNETLLTTVFEKLFQNAVDHSDADEIHAGPRYEAGQLVGFYIEDDGRGFVGETSETVFEAGVTTSNAGSGIGLAVVQETVNRHKCMIDATDSDSGGARFEITTGVVEE